MSALAGLWRFDGRPDAEAGCGQMLAAQQIYGPHDRAVVSELSGALAIGRNLYRLLPQDRFDRQPLAGPRWTLAADVRLDDREALAAAAGLPAARLPTSSDAEIVLAALERWGEDAVERLYGDFALAAFDRERRRLLLARDALGARPLFHHRGDGFFGFASMPKGLHALPQIARAPDEAFMARAMLLLMAEGPRTVFMGIERVEPGAVVVVTPESLTSRRWWKPDPAPLRLKTQADYVGAYRAELDRAVQATLRGAGEVAAHLSAGLDSSAVAATAARLLAPAGGRVVAYTAAPREGYDLPTPPGVFADEAPLAARTAALYPNMEHVVVRAGARSPLANLDRRFFLFDEPTANLCNAVWVDAINDDARARGLTVLLTGQQGNFSLNYDGMQRLPELLAQGDLIALMREWLLLKRNGYRSLKAGAALTLGPYAPRWLWNLAKGGVRGADARTYAAVPPERRPALDAEARAIHPDLDYRPWKRAYDLRLWGLRRVDLGSHHKGVLGGWGLDTRDPTADRRLVELCLSIPTDQYLRDGAPKALARAALADRLPPEVLGERRLGRQAVDWHEGMTGSLEALSAEIERIGASEVAIRVVDVPRLRALVRNWPEHGWHVPEVNIAYRAALLRGVSAGHFIRRAMGSNA